MERAEAELRLAEQRLASLDETERTLNEDAASLLERKQESQAELLRLTEEETAERNQLETLQASLAGVGAEAKKLSDEL
jgi:hypothetical protein